MQIKRGPQNNQKVRPLLLDLGYYWTINRPAPIADFCRNDCILSRAAWNLLVILSKWAGFAGNRRQQGLTLEFGAYSPSDSKHTFRDVHLEYIYPYPKRMDLEAHREACKLQADKLRLGTLNDPYHSWVDGHRNGDVSLESKQRIMGTLTINPNLPEFSAFCQKFPKVEIVTGLLIRRQFYRKIAVRSLAKLLREAFVCLRWFRHEEWHHVNPQQQLCFEKGTLKSHSNTDLVREIRVDSTLTNLILQITGS